MGASSVGTTGCLKIKIYAVHDLRAKARTPLGHENHMQKLIANDPETCSADVVAENIEHLKSLFPEAFTEGKIDFEVLKQLLGGEVDEREEKYGLNWHGKRQARQLALTPSTGTLRPCPDESVDWDTTQNLMIEGDNLEVLKLLQKSYAGKVKLIYIDPPYNTGKDFVYPDDFRDNIQNYLELTGQTDDDNRKLSSKTDASGRFHTRWLNMLYPRLLVARQLLRQDGIVCISIDDTEQTNLGKLCDEIFGEENHIATIVWQKRYVSNVTARWVSDMHDFILVYARNREMVAVNPWQRTREQLEAYRNPDNDPRGPWRAQDLSASKPYSAGQYTIVGPKGEVFAPPPNRYWRCSKAQFEEWCAQDRIWWGVNEDARPMVKSFLSESENGVTPHTWWDHTFAGHNKEATLELKELFDGDAPFDTPKPVKLVSRLLELFCTDGDTVLDFFAGSAPLAQAAMEASSSRPISLRWTMVQFPETTQREDYASIADIAKERIRRVGSKIKGDNLQFAGDLGFRVFKLDTSNIRTWEPDGDDLEQTLLDSIDHIKSDRSQDDILYELLLKLGLDLCVPVETRTIAGKDVHSIGTGTLIACLDEHISREEVDPFALGIAEWHKQLEPEGDATVIFRDSAFEDDVAKTNMAAILEQHGLGNVRSL